jgi:hypothetical protein
LTAGGNDKSVVNEIVEPLRALQHQRTTLDAHSGGERARALRTTLLKQHRTRRKHVEDLIVQLVAALKRLKELEGC